MEFSCHFLGKRLAKIGCPREKTVVNPLWDQSPAEAGWSHETPPLSSSGCWPGALGWAWLVWGRKIPHKGSKMRLCQLPPT